MQKGQQELFGNNAKTSETQSTAKKRWVKRSAITDDALAHFQAPYEETITKEDIFYYIYGLLHSEEYREKYADNLSKQLPRIPRVKTYADFSAFSQAGRDLAVLHLDYEKVPMYSEVQFDSMRLNLAIVDGKWEADDAKDEDFYVIKMKHGKRKSTETGKNENDPTTIIYNKDITISNIPENAYDYVVNGKSAIAWVMERQSVKTDKKSGITNDANDWASETMQNPRYPLELLLRVITVSLETQKIVNQLPKLVI